MSSTEATQYSIPVVGSINGSGVAFRSTFVPTEHLVLIAGCIWPLLKQTTRDTVKPYIRTRDDAGVNCWMPEHVFQMILPDLAVASRRQVIRPGIDFDEFSRYLDMLHHQDETGVQLPISPVIAAKLEAAGAEVDLVTGWVHWPQVIDVATSEA